MVTFLHFSEHAYFPSYPPTLGKLCLSKVCKWYGRVNNEKLEYLKFEELENPDAKNSR